MAQSKALNNVFKLNGIIDVKEPRFGAKGDGTTDDRAALNLARAHATGLTNGGMLFFPPGTYRVSSNLTFESDVTLFFAGGAMLSVDTAITVTINGGLIAPLRQIFSGAGTVLPNSEFIDALYPHWWGALGNGSADDYTAITACITAARNTSQRTVKLTAGTFLIGTLPLDISGVNVHGAGCIATKIKRSNSASGAYTVKLDGSTSGGAARCSYRDFQIHGNRSGNSNANYALCLIGNVLDNEFANIQILESKTGGFRTVLDSATRPSLIHATNLQIRDGDGVGIEIAAGLNMGFYNLDIEEMGGSAINISGADEAPGRLKFENFWIEKTGDGAIDAVTVAGNADRVQFAYGNVQDYGNSAGTAGHGINISAGRRVRLTGLDISPRAGSSGASHRKIVIGSSSGAIAIEDHSFVVADIEDNSTRSTYSNDSLGLQQIVTTNDTSIAAGATRYLAPFTGGTSATQTDVRVFAAGRMRLRELRVESVPLPGVGQTYTITLYKNGSATALTVQLTNSVASTADTTNEVALEPGDNYSFQVVSSGGATALAAHNVHITCGVFK